MNIDFTVVICTFNRCDSLAETLDSLGALVIPDGVQWEILIVDNNSSDETRQVVEQFRRVAPTITRYAFEPKQGLSYARNRAVDESQGSCIIFTDDDVIVEPYWLAAIAAAFRKHEADCIGGRVLPLWLSTRPTWLSDSLLNVLAMLDYGERPLELGLNGDDRCLYGANMAFKRDRLLDVGAFNTALGRRGSTGAGEDVEIQKRLRALGGKVIYEPSSVVLHKVEPGRLSKSYFRHWYYSAGKDRAMSRKPSAFFVFGIESYLIRKFFETAARLFASVIFLNWKRVFELELHCILYLSVFKHKLLLSFRN